ncbi:KOW domain-containing RNA-binding protein [Ruminococcaceae bacterium OttesenSCG-928-D13]|nr:KOW domain-containing RNA-binding protein [Ruminococcaceae bacterium OttesenSCG-928-D13]
MEVVRGQIVQSRRGRDVTKAYVAIGREGTGANERLLLCDGERRTLAAPKRKNRLHLNPTGTLLPEEALETDLKIKMALKAYHKQTGQDQQGG